MYVCVVGWTVFSLHVYIYTCTCIHRLTYTYVYPPKNAGVQDGGERGREEARAAPEGGVAQELEIKKDRMDGWMDVYCMSLTGKKKRK